MAEPIRGEKENSDWFPERSEQFCNKECSLNYFGDLRFNSSHKMNSGNQFTFHNKYHLHAFHEVGSANPG